MNSLSSHANPAAAMLTNKARIPDMSTLVVFQCSTKDVLQGCSSSWASLTVLSPPNFAVSFSQPTLHYGVRCENPTTRQLPVLTQTTVSSIGVSQKTHKTQTQGNLDKRGSDSFHNQQGRYECCCNLLLRRKLCTPAGFLRNNMHSCMNSIKFSSKSNHLENFQWKSNFKNMIRPSIKVHKSSSHAKFH